MNGAGRTDLLDGDADSDRVDGALDEDFLLVVAADDDGLEEKFFATPERGHETDIYSQPFSRKKQEPNALTALPPRACCVSPPPGRRSSPGTRRPAGWLAPRSSRAAKWPSEEH